jgi:hypothetical protein
MLKIISYPWKLTPGEVYNVQQEYFDPNWINLKRVLHDEHNLSVAYPGMVAYAFNVYDTTLTLTGANAYYVSDRNCLCW